MRKALLILVLIFGIAGLARTQQNRVLSAASATCTATSCLTVTVDPTQGGATLTVTSNASGNTIQFEASGDGGATVVSISATPSNSSTSATSTTGTGVWQVNTSGYTNIYMRMSTLAGGTTTVSIVQGTPSARGGSGGGGGGDGGSTTVLDCTTFPGADMGAKLNACLAALPADGGIANADNFTSPQTISTPVVNSFAAVIESCGLQITQTALITLSGNGSGWVGCPNAITTFTKAANIDQFEISGTGDQIQYFTLNGDRAGGFTGNGVTVDGGSLGTNVLNLNINSENAAGINDQGSAFGLFNNISISDYGVNGIIWNGTFAEARNLFIDSSGTETGPAIVESGSGSEMLVNDSWFLCNGTFACIDVNTDANFRLVHAYVSQTLGQTSPPAGAPAILVETGAALQATGSCVLAGGGTGNATVQSTSTNSVIQINGCIFDVTGGGDGVVLDGGQGIISNNSIQFQAPATGQAGVRFSGAPVAGGSVIGNYIVFPAGETPSGDNYGVWLQPPAMGGFRGIKVSGNSVEGTGNAHDFGYFFDNGNTNATADRNIFANNTCVDTSSTGCIKRTDSLNLVNLYTDNFTIVTPLFIPGGSTNDVIVQHAANSITSSTLPTAGIGSEIADNAGTLHIYSAIGGSGPPFFVNTAPSVAASGCGTAGASITASNGTAAFKVNVGTTNSGTCTITMPTAKTDWLCSATDITTTSTTVSQTKSVPGGTPATQIVLQNYTDISGTHAWVDNDIIAVTCPGE